MNMTLHLSRIRALSRQLLPSACAEEGEEEEEIEVDDEVVVSADERPASAPREDGY